MNFDLNDDQRAIKQTAREFLTRRYPLEEVRRLALEEERGFTDDQWRELSELGWPGLAVPEADGGQGLGTVELVVVAEELGYAVAPSPLHSTTSAALLLAAAGTDSQRERALAPLAAGERIGTVAVWDDPPGRSPSEAMLAPADDDTLTGRKVLVPDAGAAEIIVVVGAGGRLWLIEKGDRVEVTPTPGLDPTRKLYALELDGAPADELRGGNGQTVTRAHAQIATALAAESVGIAQRAMEMAVSYAKDREQFDRPIGAYQAVSHRCAQMLLEVEGARSAVLHAAWALDHDPESAPLAAAMAKAYASDCGFRVTASSLQVHGGIGFTWEHDLHFLLKRAKANAHAAGDARFHRERVAELIGL
ncbi:MAG: acyl-CoA dehydrogenase family protein [Solirubrobacteraceae bacterium]